jgi:Polysaccharide lyase
VSAKKNAVRGRVSCSAAGIACALVALVETSACDRNVYLGNIGDGSASLLWSATFEPGNLSEWTGDEHGGVFSDLNLMSTVTTAVAHGGRYAGLLTLSPGAGMTSTNYLFRDTPSPKAAYYSAWFYIPSTVAVGTWLSLTHFRGSPTGDGNNPTAAWDVNLYPRADGSLSAQLFDYSKRVNMQEVNPMPVPLDTWVQFEVYFVKATDLTGQIQVWQDGALIIDHLGVQTVKNDWLQWDAGGACDALTSSPATVYVDDAAISTVRVGIGS